MLTDAEAAIESEAFGPLTAELRRAEANHHDVDALLPRLVRARGFDDAEDIAAVLRHRVAAATARAAGAGHARNTPRLIAGLVPEATGSMSDDMVVALTERRALMEERADAVLDRDVAGGARWVGSLGAVPTDPRRATAWRRSARVIAAYRDRYQITSDAALGAPPDATTQKIDRARAEAALRTIEKLNRRRHPEAPVRAAEPRGLRFYERIAHIPCGVMLRGRECHCMKRESWSMTLGLTNTQEIVEINIFDKLSASIRDAILAELSQKPEHKIISLSITSYSEFSTSYRALAVIEYL